MKAWLAGLAPRERMILGTGAIVAALMLVYLFVVEPLAVERDRLRASLPALRAQAASVEAGAEEVKQLRARATSRASGGDPVTAILDTAEGAGVKDRIRSVNPTGDAVLVAMEPIAYPQLVRWLGSLATRQGIVATGLNARVPDASAPLQVETLTLQVPSTAAGVAQPTAGRSPTRAE